MYIWRNHPTLSNGSGYGHPSGHADLVGYSADTHTEQGGGSGMPTKICRHEFAHMILGNNSFHSCGGGSQTGFWIPTTGGHSMLGLAGSAMLTWNAWDRHRLGWKTPSNQHLISARTMTGSEINGDLDATVASDAGIYVLRDFVAFGDAIRIKLPYIDQTTEFQQYLRLENHRTKSNNGNIFDLFNNNWATSCVDQAEWGLTVQLQIDRDE